MYSTGETGEAMSVTDLHAALEAEGNAGTRAHHLLDKGTAPLVIENGRLFAPNWEEAYVDLASVLGEQAYAALLASKMLVFNDPRPTAFAAKIEGAGYLFVSAGLLELIAFCSYHLAVCGAASFRQGADVDEIEDHFLQIVANFVDHGWPLLGDINAVQPSTYVTTAINRDCMLLFVLLHELGHVVCGHLDGSWLGIQDFSSYLPDLDTPSHGREIEADRYACDAITNPHVLYLASGFFSVWTLIQVSRRVRFGDTAHLSATHPLAVNRLHRVVVLLRERQDADSRGDIRGLEADLKRCAGIISDPDSFGLHAVRYSPEDGRIRHDALLKRYAEITARF
jgi:hypothetical protein